MDADYEADIAGALVGGQDPERAIGRVALRFSVQKQIFCPYTNAVLDVRTAVLVEYKTAEGETGAQVMDCKHWDSIKGNVIPAFEAKSITVTVTDGREIFQ